MQKEDEEKDEEIATAFKNTLFAHSLATQNPKLYFSLYPVHDDFYVVGEDEEDDSGFEIPRSDEEMAEMMAKFNVGRIS